tara:strand:- start:783 stop:1646 length:864 start_codon:yes stop_codon:yes gene_type:complete
MKNCDRVLVVTPLKDEIDNLPKLVEAMKLQAERVYCWVVVENGSTDGSREYLESLLDVGISEIPHFFVINFTLPDESYALGVKYATVVNYGFEYAKNLSLYNEIDYIGICDADCFPCEYYYRELTEYMRSNSIDISSGYGRFLNGKHDGEAAGWVRGNCRLWSKSVFEQSGYIVGPSADALSLAKAISKGFIARPLSSLTYECREMGSRSRYDYYGYSSYYRGETFLHSILKSIKLLAVGEISNSILFLRGYWGAFWARKPRLEDEELREYFRGAILRRVKEFLNVA